MYAQVDGLPGSSRAPVMPDSCHQNRQGPQGGSPDCFASWTHEGIFTQLNVDLTGLARTTAGSSSEPTACIVDTQSMKASTCSHVDGPSNGQ